jgi:CubicO group peptidase (beta-lactamase class C family)
MDSAKLEAMMAYVGQHDMAVDSIVVVRHGRIVFEEYGPGYVPSLRHRLYSVTKSVTSMLVGIAIDQGAIEGLDVPIAELLPDYTSANPDPRRDQITLEHLLTMSDGIDWREHDFPYDDPRNTVSQMRASADAVQFVLDRPMARAPGEAWAYNSGASILLGAIVEKATGRDLLSFAREVLFDPLGVGTVYWERASGGHYHTGGGLDMTPRDMVRLGYLMLHNGRWDGQQILSAGWVARSTTAHYPAYEPYGYGYQWWILPDEQGCRADGPYHLERSGRGRKSPAIDWQAYATTS